MHIPPLAFIKGLSGADILVIGLVALLIFGRRLPEVGRNLGKVIVDFKRGLRTNEDSRAHDDLRLLLILFALVSIIAFFARIK